MAAPAFHSYRGLPLCLSAAQLWVELYCLAVTVHLVSIQSLDLSAVWAATS